MLEVAPGPGYLAIEMARLARFRVTGLDISRTMVDIAREHATAAGVAVDFLHGDATAMPFAGGSFDLVVCQAAFENFRRPVSALDEMHRVLRPGGLAVIQDLCREASAADIDREVRRQGLGVLNGFVTRRILAGLRNRAYSTARLERLVAGSRFHGCAIEVDGIGLEVRLEKPASSWGDPSRAQRRDRAARRPPPAGVCPPPARSPAPSRSGEPSRVGCPGR